MTAYDEQPAPHQVATFDQTYAELTAWVNKLTAFYLDVRAENAASRDADVAGLAGWLKETATTRDDLAELLTVAIVRIAEAEGPEPTRRTEQEGGIPNDALTRADWDAAYGRGEVA